MHTPPSAFHFPHHIAGLIIAVLMTPTPWAQAETRLEQRIAQAEAPHQALSGAGPHVAVHWVQRFEQLGDEALNRQKLAELRETVRQCIQDKQQYHLPFKPVKELPAMTARTRMDGYLAQNADIQYRHHSEYALNPEDCSLTEAEDFSMGLWWSGGLCDADLIKKTAWGQCPRDLKNLSRPRKGQSVQGIPPELAARPGLPHLTGEVRTVAGQDCDVATDPFVPGHATLCFARAKGFAGFGRALSPKGTPMLLEARSKQGITYRANIVQMNFPVSAQVFVPHLQGGFSIEQVEEPLK